MLTGGSLHEVTFTLRGVSNLQVIMQLRRHTRARAADDALAVDVTSGRISTPKPVVLLTDKHAQSLVNLEKEGGSSSSLGLEISP